MEKNRVLNQSITHSLSQSPSLFDIPGTEAFASKNTRRSMTRMHITRWHCQYIHDSVNTAWQCQHWRRRRWIYL